MTKKRNTPTADSAKSGKGGGGTLSDYVELNPRVTLAKNTSVPFVSMDIIVPGTRKVYPVQERPATGSGSKFEPKDTLFARITPCLENGKIAQYAGERPGIGSTEFFVLRARPGLSDPDFVYYFANKQEVRSAAEKSMSGASGRQRAIISSLSDFECEFPPLPTQKRIAGILSAYDDLIENCQRRISILEKMARGLYREWFVHFRFPGHEGHPRVNSPLGEIPEGWEVRAFSAIAHYINGYAFKPRDWSADGLPIIKIKELKAGITSDTPRNSGEGIPEKYRISDGCVLFSWSADLDTYLWMGGQGLLNQHLFNVVPLDAISLSYCFHALKESMPQFRALSIGATMHHIKRSALDQVFLALPPIQMRKSFEILVEPVHLQIINLTKQIQTLRRTRDLLLPRLLSGQINIGE